MFQILFSCEDKCVIHYVGVSSFLLAPLQVLNANIHYTIKIYFSGGEKGFKYIWLQSDVLDSQVWNFVSIVVIVNVNTIAEFSQNHLGWQRPLEII